MNKLATVVMIALISVQLPILAQSQVGSNPAQRRAAITRIQNGINSPDSAVRLTTLEAAAQGKDPILRHVALSTAFANADSTLRYAALIDAIASAPSLVVEIVSQSTTRALIMHDTQGRFLLEPSHFDRSTNTFSVSTSAGKGAAVILGDRLSFTARVVRPNIVCEGVTYLEPSDSYLKGTLNCPFNTEHYEIRISLLR